MPYVASDGLRIFYRLVGEGPVLLWHTGGCGDATMWESAGYLEGVPGYRHLLMDHRGHGRSEAPADLSGHLMSHYVADVVAVLDDAGVDRAGFVGYSMGARVGFALGALAPERLSALVALDNVPEPGTTSEQIRSDVEEVLARGTRAVIEEMAAGEIEAPPSWLVENLCTTGAREFAGTLEALATEPDFWAGAATFPAPVLLLLGVGERDDDWWELGQAAARALPVAETVRLSGLHHLAAFWRSDLTAPPIRGFLDTVGWPKGSLRHSR